MLIEEWSLEQNFWSLNKKFLGVELFKSLYDNDLSNNKVDSNTFMWGLSLCIDYDSIYFSMHPDDRFLMIKEKYFSTVPTIPKEFVDQYNILQKDSEKRHIDIWNKKVDEISKYLEMTTLDATNIEDVTKIMQNLDKLLNLKDTLEKRLNKETVNKRNRGGGQGSLMEDGVL